MRGREALSVGPRPLYPLKAAATRTRSLVWLLLSHAAETSPDRGCFLFYHRVSGDADELSVRPQRFAEQMAFLADAGFVVVDVVEAARRLRSSSVGSEPVVGLSFDDGYRDVAEVALPVLERHGFRATVFVATGLIDGTAPVSWYRGAPPPLLDWDDVCALDGAGTLSFEAHSVTHRNLVSLANDEARREIAGSKQALELRLGRTVRAFCYPGGVVSGRERTFAREAGYEIAVTCEPGRNGPATDPFALHRLQIDARDTLLDFRAKVAGAHDTPLPGRALYRRVRYGAPDPARASSLAYRRR